MRAFVSEQAAVSPSGEESGQRVSSVRAQELVATGATTIAAAAPSATPCSATHWLAEKTPRAY